MPRGPSGRDTGYDDKGDYDNDDRDRPSWDSPNPEPDIPPPEEADPFEFNWLAVVVQPVLGLAYNAFKYIQRFLKANPGATHDEAFKSGEENEPESFQNVNRRDLYDDGPDGDLVWKSDIADAINNSDAPAAEKEEVLLTDKQIRKRAQNYAWNRIQNPSEYDTAFEAMGLRGINEWNTTMDQMKTGEFELPEWMQSVTDDSWKRFHEQATRQGSGPGSTAYGQGASAFDIANQQSAWGFGMDTLDKMYGVGANTYAAKNQVDANRLNQLLNPQQDPQKIKTPKDGKGNWDVLWEGLGEGLTTYGGLKAGGIL